VEADASVRSYAFADVARAGARTAAGLRAAGVQHGDVVMTLMGARPEWVFALLGAWRLGAVALPCSEQLRANDIALRIERTRPALVLAAGRDMSELDAAAAAVSDPP
jgi:acyl-coenzyme A synthetase/AMP-(fatty) acid ligase